MVDLFLYVGVCVCVCVCVCVRYPEVLPYLHHLEKLTFGLLHADLAAKQR